MVCHTKSVEANTFCGDGLYTKVQAKIVNKCNGGKLENHSDDYSFEHTYCDIMAW